MPTPTARRLADGELVMFSISPKVNGYASSVGDTTAVGGKPTDAQKRLLSHMAHAYDIARKQLVVGRTGVEMDAPVRAYLLECGYAPYMLVPYIHTCGLFEAEGPFFGPRSHVVLQPHMTVCVDISLFGMPETARRTLRERLRDHRRRPGAVRAGDRRADSESPVSSENVIARGRNPEAIPNLWVRHLHLRRSASARCKYCFAGDLPYRKAARQPARNDESDSFE